MKVFDSTLVIVSFSDCILELSGMNTQTAIRCQASLECSETVFVVTWDTQYWDVLSTDALQSDLRLLSGYLKKNKSGVILKAEEE